MECIRLQPNISVKKTKLQTKQQKLPNLQNHTDKQKEKNTPKPTNTYTPSSIWENKGFDKGQD